MKSILAGKGAMGAVGSKSVASREWLRPRSLQVVYRDAWIEVARAGGPDSAGGDALESQPGSLGEAIGDLIAPLQRIGSPHFSVKVISVDLAGETCQADVLYEAWSAAPGDASAGAKGPRRIAQTARLTTYWRRAGSPPWQLVAISCRDFEEVRLIGTESGDWFVDCTGSTFADAPYYDQQIAYGLNHWLMRIERGWGMDDSVRNGIALGDANGDGLEDVYLCQGPGLPNRLLLHQPDGTVRDVAASAGVDWLDQTSAALFLDLDNDGDQDLAIATTGGLALMENDGQGQYRLRARLGDNVDVQSLAAADFDQDGRLDIYLCVYRPFTEKSRGEFVFHDATTGGSNRLYRNVRCDTEAWTFDDVASQTGLDAGASRYSLAAAWNDIDGDGDADLYVANYYGRNYLYRNDKGTFTDVTGTLGLLDTGFGMSVDWGDVNRDGRPDLYVGNMFSSAGNRVTSQKTFQRDATIEQRAVYRRMAQGNSLFIQQEDGRFEDVSDVAAVRMGRWAWSSELVDLNGDGWQDIVVANGYITTEDSGDL